jgi:hypothetical protein
MVAKGLPSRPVDLRGFLVLPLEFAAYSVGEQNGSSLCWHRSQAAPEFRPPTANRRPLHAPAPRFAPGSCRFGQALVNG